MTTKTTTTYSQECDRCGSTRHGTDDHGTWGGNLSATLQVRGNYWRTKPLDLCPKCAEELADWLHNEPAKEAAA